MHADVFRRIREGTTIMGLAVGDSICFASVCKDDDAVMVACSDGKVATFPAAEIRVSSRTAAGVRGKKLAPGMRRSCKYVVCGTSFITTRSLPARAYVGGARWGSTMQHCGPDRSKRCCIHSLDCVSVLEGAGAPRELLCCAGARVVGASVQGMSGFESASRENGPWLLMAASSGHGKRVPLSEFRFTSRGVAGVTGIKLEEGTSIVNVHVVSNGISDEAGDQASECLLSSSGGMMSRIALADISVYGRSARGVRIVKLADNDHLSSITPCTYRHMSC